MINLYIFNAIQFVRDFFPSGKTSEEISFANGLLGQNELNNRLLLDYINGADNYSGIGLWAPGAYNQDDRVIYFNTGEVYRAIRNTGNEPSLSNDWVKELDTFIGCDERRYYNGQTIMLEYALNRRFYSNFQNPPSVSDIYITKNIVPAPVFVIGSSEETSSIVFNNNSSEFSINSYSFDNIAQFDINIPLSIYNSLGADADKIIRIFVNQYVTCGIKYNIKTY